MLLNPDVVDKLSNLMFPNLYYLCFHTSVLHSSGIDFHVWCEMTVCFVFLPLTNTSFSSVPQAAEANAGDIPIIAALPDFLKATFLPLIPCIKSLSALHF